MLDEWTMNEAGMQIGMPQSMHPLIRIIYIQGLRQTGKVDKKASSPTKPH